MGIDADRPRIIIIKNSLEIENILVSEAMIDEINNTPGMKVLGEPFELKYDDEGNLAVEY